MLFRSSTTTVLDSLSRLNGHHHTLHIVAGSDRAPEYRKIAEKYNGKPDKKGNVPFHFPGGVHVHEVTGKREDVDKHPTEMSRDELERSASATKIVGLAKSGDYKGFKAYHPDIPEHIVKGNYNMIRKQSKTLKETFLSYIRESAEKRKAEMEFMKSGHKGKASQLTGVTVKELEDAAKYFKTDRKDRKLNEVIDAMIKYRMEVDRDKRLPPTRSGSKGDEE